MKPTLAEYVENPLVELRTVEVGGILRMDPGEGALNLLVRYSGIDHFEQLDEFV